MLKESLAKSFYDILLAKGEWPELTLDEAKQNIKIPLGEILSLKKREYYLKFCWYSIDEKQYGFREKFGEIIFPEDYDILEFLYFRQNSYVLSMSNNLKTS